MISQVAIINGILMYYSALQVGRIGNWQLVDVTRYTACLFSTQPKAIQHFKATTRPVPLLCGQLTC